MFVVFGIEFLIFVKIIFLTSSRILLSVIFKFLTLISTSLLLCLRFVFIEFTSCILSVKFLWPHGKDIVMSCMLLRLELNKKASRSFSVRGSRERYRLSIAILSSGSLAALRNISILCCLFSSSI